MLAALGIAETAFRSALVCTASYRAMGGVVCIFREAEVEYGKHAIVQWGALRGPTGDENRPLYPLNRSFFALYNFQLRE